VLRIINVILVFVALGNAFYLTQERYSARLGYMKLADLQNKSDVLNKEFTRLELEDGTYSSNLTVQSYAANNLGLIPADKQHTMELK
jgi:cell division protein FtsL